MKSIGPRHSSLIRSIFAGSIVCGSLCVDGIVRNLTPEGAMFESVHQLAIGQRVDLQIQGLGGTSAAVAWSIGPRAGLRFDRPLIAAAPEPALVAEAG